MFCYSITKSDSLFWLSVASQQGNQFAYENYKRTDSKVSTHDTEIATQKRTGRQSAARTIDQLWL
jgi:hypothetical protein